jgi:hypothetical protein
VKERLSALLVAAAVVSGGRACIASADGLPAIEAAQATAGSTTLMARGTIGKFDASSRVLFLSTANGTLQFPVSSTARIRVDGHAVEVSELAHLRGHPAAVRYSESRGTRNVESVHVFREAEDGP